MKFRDEYRDGKAAQAFADAIARIATRPWTLMEVCGGQTHAIVPWASRWRFANRPRVDLRASSLALISA